VELVLLIEFYIILLTDDGLDFLFYPIKFDMKESCLVNRLDDRDVGDWLLLPYKTDRRLAVLMMGKINLLEYQF
jgi:hypothetical protein